MNAYETIEKAISNNDIEALREAIGSICYTSRDFSSGEFDEAVRYVESKGIKLKDNAIIGAPTISSQKREFTDQDFARAIFELKKNFCDERIEDVKTIGKSLYGHNHYMDNNPSTVINDNTTRKQASLENQKKAQKITTESKKDLSPNLLGHSHNLIWIMISCAVAIVIFIAVILLLHGRK